MLVERSLLDYLSKESHYLSDALPDAHNQIHFIYNWRNHSSLQTNVDIVLHLVDQFYLAKFKISHILNFFKVKVVSFRVLDNCVTHFLHILCSRRDYSLKIQKLDCLQSKLSLNVVTCTFEELSRYFVGEGR